MNITAKAIQKTGAAPKPANPFAEAQRLISALRWIALGISGLAIIWAALVAVGQQGFARYLGTAPDYTPALLALGFGLFCAFLVYVGSVALGLLLTGVKALVVIARQTKH